MTPAMTRRAVAVVTVLIGLLVACGRADDAANSISPPAAGADPSTAIVKAAAAADLTDGALIKGSANTVYIVKAGTLHPVVVRSVPVGMQNAINIPAVGWLDSTYLQVAVPSVGPFVVVQVPDDALGKLPKGPDVEGSAGPRQ